MSNKNLVLIAVLVVFVVLGFFYFKGVSGREQTFLNKEVQVVAEDSALKNNAKEFIVTGANFSFDPKEITVNKGDRVKITFKNAEGFHDFVIDEFGVKTKQIKADEEETVEFVADQAGEFEYYCSVGQHRSMGMWGVLKVE